METSIIESVYYLETVNDYQTKFSIVIKQKTKGRNTRPEYQLLNENGLTFKLSNQEIITIPKGFIWDGSSTPRIIQWLLGTDGDFEIAALIHDYLYEQRLFSRKFADEEMLKWSKAVNGTLNKISFRNFDNHIRYYAVRIFGSYAWRT